MGALLLLPLLNHVVGTSLAIPLLTLAQAVGNASRMGWGWREIRWRPVTWFLASAIPCAVLGALSFVVLPKALVVRCIGAAILVFVALTYFKLLRLRAGRRLLAIGGGVVGFLSGLVGSAGPLGAAIFLTLELPPVAYIASEGRDGFGAAHRQDGRSISDRSRSAVKRACSRSYSAWP